MAGQQRSGGAGIDLGEDAQPAVSEEDKAKAEAQAAAADAPKSDERFVQYLTPLRAANKAVTRPSGAGTGDGSPASRVGVASAECIITEQHWAQVGIAGKSLVFSFDNNWRVPVSQVTDAQLKYLLNDDRRYNGVRFEVVDADGNKVAAK
ncbi:hypothetical protein [Mycobacterium asiaticum]|uniref:Uncharacterized protein n=1 Tax=Mycobacterium asiaticum TaxID=1790 RepID=A0A1A3MYD2_MYCAS|nr:hypothetical protein [Mycobacterium asiaticum]OBK14090.1 hypothetical protein A5635_10370 [Mycobacterium asiaticum]